MQNVLLFIGLLVKEWKKEKVMGMNQVFAEIGHGVEVVAKDIAKGATEVLTVGAKVLKVIADVRAMGR